MPVIIAIILIALAVWLAVTYWYIAAALFVIWIGYRITRTIRKNRYFKGEVFQAHKRELEAVVKEHNDIAAYTAEIRENGTFQIGGSDTGAHANLATFENTSKNKYKRNRNEAHYGSVNVHNCSLQVVRNASADPIKYLMKYFNIKPTEVMLANVEEFGDSIARLDDAVTNVRQRESGIITTIDPPKFILKHYKDEFMSQVGVEFSEIKIPYPEYVFEYVSAGGNSSQRSSVTLDTKTTDVLIETMSEKIRFRKSIAGQRALMTARLREAIKSRDNYTCRSCSVSLTAEPHLLLEVDHIIPVSRGGMTSEDNLQTLCWRCNRSKSNKEIPAKQEKSLPAEQQSPAQKTDETTLPPAVVTAEVTKMVRLEIVGMYYYDFPSSVIGATKLRLVREPKNPHDANAIAVWQGRHHIGHIPASVARTLAPALDANRTSKLDVAGQVNSPTDGYVDVPEWTTPDSSAPAETMADLTLAEPWGRLANRVELEGTESFEAEIGTICEGLGASGYGEPARLSDIEGAMTLTPSRRVGLYINGLQVGWLPDDVQDTYRDPVAHLSASGSAVKVTLSIWMARDYKFSAYISGRLPDPDQIEVPYGMPAGVVAVLPVGGKVQVTGEEHHLEELLAILDGEQRMPVVVEMVSLVKRTARTEKTVVGIHIGGEAVGELTPHMSEHFLPVIAACEDEGVALVCRGEVIGNQLKADVNLHACRGGDLPSSWITDNIYGAAAAQIEGDVVDGEAGEQHDASRPAPRRMAADDWDED